MKFSSASLQRTAPARAVRSHPCQHTVGDLATQAADHARVKPVGLVLPPSASEVQEMRRLAAIHEAQAPARRGLHVLTQRDVEIKSLGLNDKHFQDVEALWRASEPPPPPPAVADTAPPPRQKTVMIDGVLSVVDAGRFKGETLNGKRHGEGSCAYSDGSAYKGQWADDGQCGVGEYVSRDGARYRGQWDRAKRHGQGEQLFSNGDLYAGQFERGQQTGEGTMVYVTGACYKGQWWCNSYHGYGELTYPNGTSYAGGWCHGQRHGQGCFSTPSSLEHQGSSYTGIWDENRPPRVSSVASAAGYHGGGVRTRQSTNFRPQRGHEAPEEPHTAMVQGCVQVRVTELRRIDRGTTEEAWSSAGHNREGEHRTAAVQGFSSRVGAMCCERSAYRRAKAKERGGAFRPELLPYHAGVAVKHQNSCPESHLGVQRNHGAVHIGSSLKVPGANLEPQSPPSRPKPKKPLSRPKSAVVVRSSRAAVRAPMGGTRVRPWHQEKHKRKPKSSTPTKPSEEEEHEAMLRRLMGAAPCDMMRRGPAVELSPAERLLKAAEDAQRQRFSVQLAKEQAGSVHEMASYLPVQKMMSS